MPSTVVQRGSFIQRHPDWAHRHAYPEGDRLGSNFRKWDTLYATVCAGSGPAGGIFWEVLW